MKMKKAFTLAEVLITLTVVGVIAALTMPVLINKIGDIVLQNQRKKAHSVLANGIKMFTSRNTPPYLRDTKLKKCFDDVECISQEVKKEFKVVEDSLTDGSFADTAYVLDNEEYAIWKDSNFNYVFRVPDGMIFGLYKNQDSRDELVVVADANGLKNPNTAGKDLCAFSFDSTGLITSDQNTCNMDAFVPNTCSEDNLAGCDQNSCTNLVCSVQGCNYVWMSGNCKRLCKAIKPNR